MNIQKLKDTLTPGEPFADDAAALAYMQENVTVQRDASNGDVLGWAGTSLDAQNQSAIEAIEKAASTGSGVGKGLAKVALLRMQGGGGLTLSDPDIQGFLAALVATGVLEQTQVDALNAANAGTKTRWEAAGFPAIDDLSMSIWVTAARAL